MKQCLIVDDSRVTRKVARKIIEDLRFTVHEAEGATAALELCHRKMPDAILLDGRMGSSSTAEFLRAVRRFPGGDRPIIIFSTIENDAEHIAEIMSAGANDYIMKPFDRALIATTFADAGLL